MIYVIDRTIINSICVRVSDPEGGTTFIPINRELGSFNQFLASWKSGDIAVTYENGSPAAYNDDAVKALGLELLKDIDNA